MKTFEYSKPDSLSSALNNAPTSDKLELPSFRFIAGGTTLVDLMKLNVEVPSTLMDITGLPLDKIETTKQGGLKIGALVRNSDLANHPYVKTHYSALSEAILAGASTQLRNRPPPVVTFFRGRDVHTLEIRRMPATSANLVPGVLLSKVNIEILQSWEQANTAWLATPQI